MIFLRMLVLNIHYFHDFYCFSFISRDITRIRSSFILMTGISAKTFGRKRLKIMHFLDALPLFILKEKNIDYSAGDHPLGILQNNIQ